MPMPAPNTPWPPADYQPAIAAIKRDDALLTGKLGYLNSLRADKAPRPYEHRAQFNGGLLGATAKAIYGRPNAGLSETYQLTHHLPIADELTTVLADYMAGKPPAAILAPDDEWNTHAQDALDRLVTSDDFAVQWWNAVYSAGALGWVYGRVVWNKNVQDTPWIEWIDADCGIAEFENGQQVAVTFWDTYPAPEGKKVYRLLQRHTAGRIEYQLYEGSHDNIGRPVPFMDCAETQHLANLEGLQDGTILVTGATTPTAHMLSNYRPRREWRHDPTLRYYSTSDIARGADIFETIDQVWSQFQSEIDAAKGRLFVSEDLLLSAGPGSGQVFDWHQGVFPVGVAGDPDAKPTFEQVQFDMRVEKYTQALDTGIRKAVSALGLSPFTVDMDPGASGDMTATETRARTKRTRQTAETKGRMQRAHLSAILTAYVEMDALLNGYQPPTQPVLVSLPDQIEVSENEISDAVVTQHNAGVMSLRTAVRKLHPEWTPDEVDAELQELERQHSYAVDPFALPSDTNPNPGE
ncbi:hypothetical protein CPHO_08360 [Corynebacterium phocae]|uniref:Phage portal protein n=1 Tax=Corynebacterium phocae TaxID=161895 RepID=A0A1L7D4B0_9CORY|nr:phage portal protein [Corynebacterium phocae]APT92897.1 hypothetical protein CPHO_08360 [Corynebacterium phocae]KAA8723219.1 phage portal protein [Corynebacterium phocae]